MTETERQTIIGSLNTREYTEQLLIFLVQLYGPDVLRDEVLNQLSEISNYLEETTNGKK